MNGIGVVQISLIVAIHFSRHGDGPLSIVTSLFRNIGYGANAADRTLKSTLAGLLLLDRGYHIAAVILFALALSLNYLGTHSEKIEGWAFCTDSKARKSNDQVAVSRDGAKSAFFASRKISRVPSNAILYRNGSKGVGNLHTSLPLNGVWDLIRKKPLATDDKAPSRTYYFVHPRVKGLMNSWEGLVLELTQTQAQTPWFEMRPGHATGTTFYQWLCASKFTLLKVPSLEDGVRLLLELFGMNITMISSETVSKKTQKQLKTSYKALGYTYTRETTVEDMVQVICEQIPMKGIIFQHIVRSWCMVPIKRKSKAVSEAFRQGHLAEIEIGDSLGAFMKHESRGAIVSVRGSV